MNIKGLIIITIMFLIPGWACEKKVDIIELHFNETGFANPWSISNANQVDLRNNDPDYQNKAKSSLEQQNKDIKVISVSNDGPANGCFSCGCITGKRINITICELDKTRALNIGFYFEN
jgi:hypothetical protein